MKSMCFIANLTLYKSVLYIYISISMIMIIQDATSYTFLR